jgi:hypothetical protein
MTKRVRTPAQLANDERLRNTKTEAITQPEPVEETVTQETDMQSMQRQINEMMESNALLKAALLQKGDVAQYQNTQGQPQVNQQGSMTGTFEKYVLDQNNYPSPVERLAAEPRLLPLAFAYNYHLTYKFTTRQYDTKQGINTIEPEFTIELLRFKLNDDGTHKQIENQRTKKMQDEAYRVRRLIFHEDPQAAMAIAHENNLDIDKDDERNFLNEMRYLRVKDWLFDIFWPSGAQDQSTVREEVIGNQLVEIVAVNSEQSTDLSSKLGSFNSKLRA